MWMTAQVSWLGGGLAGYGTAGNTVRLTKCLESPPTGLLVQLTVKQCEQHWPQRTGPGVWQWEEWGQLPSFCKQFSLVSISTVSCNGQSALAALEIKTVLVSHSLSLQGGLSFLAQMVVCYFSKLILILIIDGDKLSCSLCSKVFCYMSGL